MVWQYSRIDRLTSLIARAEAMATFLYRERCDRMGEPAVRAALDARRAILDARIHAWQRERRRLRRLATAAVEAC